MAPHGRIVCQALASSVLDGATLVLVRVPRRVLVVHQPHARLGGGPGYHLVRPPVSVGASLRSRLGVSRVYWATCLREITPRAPHPRCASFSGCAYRGHSPAYTRPLMGLFPVYAIMYMY